MTKKFKNTDSIFLHPYSFAISIIGLLLLVFFKGSLIGVIGGILGSLGSLWFTFRHLEDKEKYD